MTHDQAIATIERWIDNARDAFAESEIWAAFYARDPSEYSLCKQHAHQARAWVWISAASYLSWVADVRDRDECAPLRFWEKWNSEACRRATGAA